MNLWMVRPILNLSFLLSGYVLEELICLRQTAVLSLGGFPTERRIKPHLLSDIVDLRIDATSATGIYAFCLSQRNAFRGRQMDLEYW